MGVLRRLRGSIITARMAKKKNEHDDVERDLAATVQETLKALFYGPRAVTTAVNDFCERVVSYGDLDWDGPREPVSVYVPRGSSRPADAIAARLSATPAAYQRKPIPVRKSGKECYTRKPAPVPRLSGKERIPAAYTRKPTPVRRLSGKEWIPEVVKPTLDKLLAMGITEAARWLASQTPPDGRPVTPRYIERRLHDHFGFPKAFRGSPK